MISKTFKRIFTIIVIVGIANGIYLSILKLSNNESMCIKGLGDCATVNSSMYSQIYGIPIAILGTLAYFTLLILTLLDGRNAFWSEYGIYFIFGVTLVGTAYSAYLTYLELEIIRAICPFCVLSAISMLTLFIMSTYRLVKTQAEINP
jgi:uncharacterized membrane protein